MKLRSVAVDLRREAPELHYYFYLFQPLHGRRNSHHLNICAERSILISVHKSENQSALLSHISHEHVKHVIDRKLPQQPPQNRFDGIRRDFPPHRVRVYPTSSLGQRAA